MKHIKYSAIAIISLVGCYTLLMSVIYLIPNDLIKKNVDFSVQNLVIDGDYPVGLFGASTMLDNFTDTLMLNHCISSISGNVFQKGLDINGYARYWHGYQVFLRPMLIVFDDVQIKYINLFLFYFLLIYLIILLNKEMGGTGVFAFLFPLIMCQFYMIPISKQFFSAFFITLLAGIYILKFYKNVKNDLFAFVFFLIVGSLTSFFDLLTVPLLTLGIPLIILYFLTKERFSPLQGVFFIIKNSLSWFLGYGLSWFFKWLIANIALGRDVLIDAFQSVLFRIAGECEEVKVTLFSGIRENIYRMMYTYPAGPLIEQPTPNSPVKYISFVIILLVLIVFAVVAIRYKINFRSVKKAAPLLLIATYPYIWYAVLANHSTIHAFTYRAQLITGFAVLLFLFSCVDLNALKRITRRET